MKKIQALLLVWAALLSMSFAQRPADVSKPASKLVPPTTGKIKVAFVLTDMAVMIDYAGPWEVFQDVMVPSRGEKMEDQHVFELYTVSDNKKPIRTSGGMQVVPEYTFDDAPQPMIVVIPAQMGDSPKMLGWIREMSANGNVVMSVCNGAFTLAETGLLDGHPATSHHSSYVAFQRQFPKIEVERDRRWVESTPTIFTAGGLSSGIDLALHLVELYFGRDIAQETAQTMEYEGRGWKGDGASVADYAHPHSNPADRYSKGILGNWQGKIASTQGTFKVAVHIWPGKDGKLMGTDSLDEDRQDLRLSAINYTSSPLRRAFSGRRF
jgi:putative intracellular protease/amidase